MRQRSEAQTPTSNGALSLGILFASMVSKVSIPGFNSGGSVSKADVRSNIIKHKHNI